MTKKATNGKKPKIRQTEAANLIKTATILLTTLTETALSTNLLTNFPPTLNLALGDTVGFVAQKFINGSYIQRQSFPYPFIKSASVDKKIHSFQLPTIPMANCSLTRTTAPLEFVSLCNKQKVIYHTYSPDFSSMDLVLSRDMVSPNSTSLSPHADCQEMVITMSKRIVLACLENEGPAAGGRQTKSLTLGLFYIANKTNSTNLDLFNGSMISVKNFTNATQQGVGKISFSIIQNATNETIVMAYQSMYSKQLKTLNETSSTIVIFKVVNNTMKLLHSKPNAISKQIRKGHFLRYDWLYLESGRSGELIPCKFNNSGVFCNHSLVKCENPGPECNKSALYHMTGSTMNMWEPLFRGKTEMPIMHFVTDKQAKRCELKELPLSEAQMKCSKMDMKFELFRDEILKGTVAPAQFIISYSTTYAIVSFYKVYTNGEDVEKHVQGYIKLGFTSKTVKYTSLSPMEAVEIYFPKYYHKYLIKIGKQVSLYQLASKNFFLTSPIKQKSAEVYFSSYSVLAESYKQERPFVVHTKLVRMENEYEQVHISNISQLTVYNDQRYYIMGATSQLFKGNGVNLEVDVVDHGLPELTVNYKNLVMNLDRIDDSDITKLIITEGGYILFMIAGAMQHEGTVKLFKFGVESYFDNITHPVFLGEHTLNKAVLGEALDYEGSVYFLCNFVEQFPSYVTLYRYSLIDKLSPDDIGKKLYPNNTSAVKNKTSRALIDKGHYYEMNFSMKIVPSNSNCKMKMFGGNLLTVCATRCNFDCENNDYRIVVSLFDISNKTKITKIAESETKPQNFGNPGYKPGMVKFFSGSQKKAMVINNNAADLSLLEISFTGIEKNVPIMISRKHQLNPILRNKDNTPHWIQVCPTISSVFFLNEHKATMYGANIDAIGGTYLQIPLNGNDRLPSKLICSNKYESFQVVASKRFYPNERFLLNYFGFDGAEANKKLQREIKIGHSHDSIASAAVDTRWGGLILSYMYNKKTMYQNETVMIDLNGPMVLKKFDSMVDGVYQTKYKLTNSKNMTSALNSTVKVITPFQLEVETLSKLPAALNKVMPLRSYLNWNGSLFSVQLKRSEERKLLKVLPSLRHVANYTLKKNERIRDCDKGYLIIENKVDKYVQISQAYNASKYLTRIEFKNYSSCSKPVIRYIKQQIVVVTQCIQGMASKLVLDFYSLGTAGGNSTAAHRIERVLPFNVVHIEVTSTEDTLTAALKEDSGDRIMVLRMDLTVIAWSADSMSQIVYQWRLPGEIALISEARFRVATVKSVDVLIIMNRFSSSIRLYSLNYTRNSIENLTHLVSKRKTAFTFISCVTNQTNNELVCLAGEVGAYFERFVIEVDEKTFDLRQKSQTELKGQITDYFLPTTKVTDFSYQNIEIGNDFFYMSGSFGEFDARNASGGEIPQANLTKLVNGDIPPQLTSIVYKVGEQHPYAFPKYEVVSMDKDENDNTTYLIQQNPLNKTQIRISTIAEFELQVADDAAYGYEKPILLQLLGNGMLEVEFVLSEAQVDIFNMSFFMLVLLGVAFLVMLLLTARMCCAVGMGEDVGVGTGQGAGEGDFSGKVARNLELQKVKTA